MLAAAHQAVADLLGTGDPRTTVFGANMTTLTFAFSRAMARHWRPGDEVIVTRLDHDANVTPWVLAARDAGATVRHVDVRRDDCTLDLEQLRCPAVGPDATGGRGLRVERGGHDQPRGRDRALGARGRRRRSFSMPCITRRTRSSTSRPGAAITWPARRTSSSGRTWASSGADAELLTELPAYKVRPAADTLPDRWMTGTQNHEGIAGVLAAIDYLAELGRQCAGETATRREALAAAMTAVGGYERGLCERLIAGLTGAAKHPRVGHHRREAGARSRAHGVDHAPPHRFERAGRAAGRGAASSPGTATSTPCR